MTWNNNGRRPIVFIPNKSGHDFSGVEKWGRPVFLTEGQQSRYATNYLYRVISEVMRDSASEDFLVITSLPIINAIAAGILAHKHGRVNFLIYRFGAYVNRDLCFGNLLEGQNADVRSDTDGDDG